MSRRLTVFAIALGSCLSAFAPRLEAQQTRAEKHARKQAEKAKVTQPPTSNRAERILARLQNSPVLGGTPTGLFPMFRTIHPGGWLALGAGYRRPFADTGSVGVAGAWSVRNFKTIELDVRSPDYAHGKLAFDLNTSWLDAPSVAFYGVGAATRKQDKATFGYEPITVGVTGRARPHRFVTIGAGIDYLDITTSPSPRRNSIETKFAASDVPGFGTNPTYIRSRGFAQFDWRQTPGYTGTGGLYRAEIQRYADRGDSNVGFNSFEGEIIQLVPFLRANWVIALRGLVTVTDADAGSVVPFYLLPAVGGSRTLRGYGSFRFRGDHRLATSIEYRWTPAKFLDMAIFYDAGKAVGRTRDLNFARLKSSYGIGARIHGLSGTVLRWELAHSREQALRFTWAAGAAF